jgi:thiamine pyrophosphate-dependent acetolactate synthase large subunit-like protein
MSQTVAEVIVETLQAAGVKHCWGVPGDTLNYVTDAIRRSGIKWVQITSEERDFDFPQEVDFEQVYRSCSVFCSEIRSPAQARRKTAMAAQAALAKPGVAVLILPVDISKAVAPDQPPAAPAMSGIW